MSCRGKGSSRELGKGAVIQLSHHHNCLSGGIPRADCPNWPCFRFKFLKMLCKVEKNCREGRRKLPILSLQVACLHGFSRKQEVFSCSPHVVVPTQQYVHSIAWTGVPSWLPSGKQMLQTDPRWVLLRPRKEHCTKIETHKYQTKISRNKVSGDFVKKDLNFPVKINHSEVIQLRFPSQALNISLDSLKTKMEAGAQTQTNQGQD